MYGVHSGIAIRSRVFLEVVAAEGKTVKGITDLQGRRIVFPVVIESRG